MRIVPPLRRGLFNTTGSIILVGITALFTAYLTVYEAGVWERDALVAEVDGERIVTFRPAEGFVISPEWTVDDIRELRSLPDVSQLVWLGSEQVTQTAGNPLAIPMANASPGFPSFFRKRILAGRDLEPADERFRRIVLSETLAREIFSGVSLADIIERRVTIGSMSFEIVGIYEGEGPAYRAQDFPRPTSSNRPGAMGSSVDRVFLRVSENVSVARAIRAIEEWLEERDHLATIEAVAYVDTLDSSFRIRRTPFLIELAKISRFALVLCSVVAILSFGGCSSLSVLRRMEYIGVARSQGAMRSSILRQELARSLAHGGVPIAIGVIIGLAGGDSMGGKPGMLSVVGGMMAGVSSLTVGTIAGVGPSLLLTPRSLLAKETGFVRRVGRPVVLGAVLVVSALLVVSAGFQSAGRERVERELRAIGADRVELRSGSSLSALPAALAGPGDQEALARRFPDLPSVFVARVGATLLRGDRSAKIDLFLVHGAYEEVSGTRLERGTWWTESDPGLVLGSEVAEKLFEDADPVGEDVQVVIPGLAIPWKVVGVASPPETDSPSTLQLRANAAAAPRKKMPIGLLPFGSIHLLIDRPQQADPVLQEAARLLGERHPGYAPFRASLPAEHVMYEADLLRRESQRIQASAGLMTALALVGTWGLLHADAIARRREYALLRAIGASGADLRRLAIRDLGGRIAMAGAIGACIGGVVFFAWARVEGYDVRLPIVWLLGVTLCTAIVGVALGSRFARWSFSETPMSLLAKER